ncbi:hypothetical protein AZSI13_21880 [Azospira sp. I13]|nr:hypothetical protein AZSI13_21880 [Azospira sp. I13]
MRGSGKHSHAAMSPASPSPASRPRWVLDTNVVLDLYMFEEPSLQPLARVLAEGRAVALANSATLDELARVLAYPQFKVDEARQAVIHARYAALVERQADGLEAPPLPQCRDRDDQKFIELAVTAQADWLLSKDKLVLKMARRRGSLGDLRILAPLSALALLEAEPTKVQPGTAP